MSTPSSCPNCGNPNVKDISDEDGGEREFLCVGARSCGHVWTTSGRTVLRGLPQT